MNVAFGICTYQRAAQLDSLLAALADQTWTRLLQPAVTAFVVENDAAGLAKDICNKYSIQGRLSVRHIIEPRPGIPIARNRLLDLTTNHFDFIAFIDDDELPESDWLEQLLLLQIASNADVVAGPCIASYVNSPPEWMVRGRFHDFTAPISLSDEEPSTFDRVRKGLKRRFKPANTFASGMTVQRFSTSNVLIRTELLRATRLRFDETLGPFGGSDTLLSKLISLAGYRMVWCNEAIVHHITPPRRMTAHWLIRRALQHGYQATLIDSVLAPGFMAKLQSFMFALGRALFNLLLLPLAVFRGRHHVVWHLLQVARGCGQLMAQFGITLTYYRYQQ